MRLVSSRASPAGSTWKVSAKVFVPQSGDETRTEYVPNGTPLRLNVAVNWVKESAGELVAP